VKLIVELLFEVLVIILNQMNIKKKPSLSKINEKKLSSTAREMFWPG
jgi:hypothetical protein